MEPDGGICLGGVGEKQMSKTSVRVIIYRWDVLSATPGFEREEDANRAQAAMRHPP